MNKIRAIEINIDDEAFDDDFDESLDEDFDFEGDYVEIVEPEEEERVYAIRPNKTQIKLEIAGIAALAEELCGLTPKQLQPFDFTELVYNAIVQVATMPLKGARKRQLKYITAALRKLELAPIQERLARLKSQSAHAVREQHLAERWRDKLLSEEGHTLLTQFLAEYPHADSQQIRQLQRNAKKEAATGKPPKSARLLYKTLKNIFEASSNETTEETFEEETDFTADA